MKRKIYLVTFVIVLIVWSDKLNSQNLVWAKKMGGSDNDYGLSITFDKSGNVYVTGYFNGTSDFDPSPVIYNLTSFGGKDIFVSKLDHSGNFLWAKQMGGEISASRPILHSLLKQSIIW